MTPLHVFIPVTYNSSVDQVPKHHPEKTGAPSLTPPNQAKTRSIPGPIVLEERALQK